MQKMVLKYPNVILWPAYRDLVSMELHVWKIKMKPGPVYVLMDMLGKCANTQFVIITHVCMELRVFPTPVGFCVCVRLGNMGISANKVRTN